MTKLYSLFAGTTTDTEVKAVAENQIIQMEGYSYDRYVVHLITHDKYGYHYHLINLRTLDIQQSEIIKPLSQKFGIGMYYDENNSEFMPEKEVAKLYAKANAKEDAEQEKERLENERRKAVREIGRKWLNENLPKDVKAIIVARLKADESDSQTDYYASRVTRTVIIGFSKHKRDIFSEMRKYASNFEETAHLANYNESYEHRKSIQWVQDIIWEKANTADGLLRNPRYTIERTRLMNLSMWQDVPMVFTSIRIMTIIFLFKTKKSQLFNLKPITSLLRS